MIFTKDIRSLPRKRDSSDLWSDRDSIKVIDKYGNPSLLVERESSIIGRLANVVNFIPNVYGNDAAIELLRSRKMLER